MHTMKQLSDAIMGGATRAHLREMVKANRAEADQECPYCDGGSKETGECSHCNGLTYRDCPACGGTGKRTREATLAPTREAAGA